MITLLVITVHRNYDYIDSMSVYNKYLAYVISHILFYFLKVYYFKYYSYHVNKNKTTWEQREQKIVPMLVDSVGQRDLTEDADLSASI